MSGRVAVVAGPTTLAWTGAGGHPGWVRGVRPDGRPADLHATSDEHGLDHGRVASSRPEHATPPERHNRRTAGQVPAPPYDLVDPGVDELQGLVEDVETSPTHVLQFATAPATRLSAFVPRPEEVDLCGLPERRRDIGVEPIASDRGYRINVALRHRSRSVSNPSAGRRSSPCGRRTGAVRPEPGFGTGWPGGR